MVPVPRLRAQESDAVVTLRQTYVYRSNTQTSPHPCNSAYPNTHTPLTIRSRVRYDHGAIIEQIYDTALELYYLQSSACTVSLPVLL